MDPEFELLHVSRNGFSFARLRTSHYSTCEDIYFVKTKALFGFYIYDRDVQKRGRLELFFRSFEF